jgi:hypothetical protein
MPGRTYDCARVAADMGGASSDCSSGSCRADQVHLACNRSSLSRLIPRLNAAIPQEPASSRHLATIRGRGRPAEDDLP